MFEIIKSILISRTFWSALIALIATALQFFGVDFGADEQKALVDSVLQIVAAASAALAIVFRIKAKKIIGKP
jgi:ABC-type Mn2+/Zn2+ transport system permease subunit